MRSSTNEYKIRVSSRIAVQGSHRTLVEGVSAARAASVYDLLVHPGGHLADE